MTRYIDEETGLEIPESELGNYEEIPDESFLGNIWDSTKDIASDAWGAAKDIWREEVPTAREIVNEIAQSGLGVVRGATTLDDAYRGSTLESLVNTYNAPWGYKSDGLFDIDKETVERAKAKASDYINQLEQSNKDIAASEGAEEGSGSTGVRNFLSETAGIAPSLIGGALGFGLGGFGSAEAELAGREARGEDFSTGEELGYAGGNALLNAAGARLLIPKLSQGGSLPGKILSGATTNMALSPLFTLGHAGIGEAALGDELPEDLVDQAFSAESLGSAAAQGAIFSAAHNLNPVKAAKSMMDAYKSRNIGTQGTEFPIDAVAPGDPVELVSKASIEKTLREVDEIIANAPKRGTYKIEQRIEPEEVIEQLREADNTKKASKSKIIEAPAEEGSKSFPDELIIIEKANPRPEEFQAVLEQLQASKEGGRYSPDTSLVGEAKAPEGKLVEGLSNMTPEEGALAKDIIRAEEYKASQEAEELPTLVKTNPPVDPNLVRQDLVPPLETPGDFAAARKYLRDVATRGESLADGGLKEVAPKNRVLPTKGSEGGFIRLGETIAEDGPSVYKKMRVAIKDFFTPEGIQEAGKVFGYQTGEIPTDPKSENFFRGKLGNADLGSLSDIRSWYRKKFINPSTVAQKFDSFKQVFESGLNYSKTRDLIATDAAKTLGPLLSLSPESQARVGDVLRSARLKGGSVKLDAETLGRTKHGKTPLSPDEINAILATRETMDNLMARWGEALIKKGIPVEQVEQIIEKNWRENYIPLSRFGDLFIAANKDGQNYFFTNETKKAHKLQLKTLTKEGYTVTSSGKLKPTNSELYEGLPFDFVARMGAVDPELQTQIQGFQKHLIQSKDVPGFSQDIVRSVASYVQEISNYIAKTEAKIDLRKSIDAIPAKEQSLKAYAQRYANDLLSNNTSKTSKRVRTFMTLQYLALNPKSVLVNGTQSLTTTLPNLMQYVDSPTAVKTLSSSMADAVDFLSHEAGTNKVSKGLKGVGKAATAAKQPLAERDPELYEHLKTAVSSGLIDAQIVRELAAYARGVKPGTAMEASMYMFSSMEVFNRAVAEISHYKVGRMLGKSGAELAKFAEEGNRDTQFDYTMANRPEIFRGPVGSALGVFRLFQGNYQRLFRNLATVDAKAGIPFTSRKAIRSAGTMAAAMASLGGMSALPLWKILDYTLQRSGVDTKNAVRKVVDDEKMADAVLYGLPALAGYQISGSLSSSDLNPDFSKGVPEAIGNLIGGAPLGYAGKVADSIYQYTEKDAPLSRAVENVAPEALKNLMSVYRGATEGWRTAGTNMPLVENPSTGDLILKGLGFQPMSLTKAGEKNNAIYKLNKSSRDNDNINYKLALALYNQDKKRFVEILKEAAENKKTPNKAAIKRHFESMTNPEKAMIKNLPKVAREEGMNILELYRNGR